MLISLTSSLCNLMDIPDTILEYYEEKQRDLPKPKVNEVSKLLHALDCAIIDQLHHNGPQEAVDRAFEAVLEHPESTWKAEVLSYRIRQLHYH